MLTGCGVAGPIIGGFVTQSHLGWRWTAWITLIMTALFGVIGLFCIPETSAQAILTAKAKRLRSQTNNQALHSQMEENPLNARRLVTVYLVRPFVMLMHEPILSLLTAYMSFLYGVLYLLFAAYPIAFHEDRGWNIGVASLPFASFIVGIMMGTGVIAFSTRTNFTKSYLKHGKVVPEERLPPMVVGAVALPIGLFWFAWTSNPNITWVPQVLSSAVIGLGMLVTFWQGINYIIDCYGFVRAYPACEEKSANKLRSIATAPSQSTHSSAALLARLSLSSLMICISRWVSHGPRVC